MLGRTCGVCFAVLAHVAVVGCGGSDPPQLRKKDVIVAWDNVGAKSGWLAQDEYGWLSFTPNQGEEKADELPVFSLQRPWEAGLLAKLPSPEGQFGLDLTGVKITDRGLLS